MLSEVQSSISSILKFLNEIKKSPFKTIVNFFIISTIILVKPLIFYSKLYISFCSFIISLLIFFLLFCIFYKLISKRIDKEYHKETLNYLIGFCSIILICLIIDSKFVDDIFNSIYELKNITKDEFFDIIHKTEYFTDFYEYVFSNIEVVILYGIEFCQTLSIVYIVVYIFNRLIIAENSISEGLYRKDFEIMFINTLIIIISSPFLYKEYIDFWYLIF